METSRASRLVEQSKDAPTLLAMGLLTSVDDSGSTRSRLPGYWTRWRAGSA